MALVHQLGWDPGFMARSAWFWPLRRAATPLAQLADWPTRAELDAMLGHALTGKALAPLRFGANVNKAEKYAHGHVVVEALYDARIACRGEVPTRERDWHDLFNALCFASFPRAKRALHARQYRALAERLGPSPRSMPNARTKEQDALTLFDEGGMAIAAEIEAARAILAADAAELPELLAQLERAGRARSVPFGHALFEHLVEGITCPGGGTRVLELAELPRGDAELVDAVDRALCALLEDPRYFQTPAEHLSLRFNRMAEVPPIEAGSCEP